MGREDVKYFIQKILGCGCPENVFEHIECYNNVKINNIILKSKINIGNRLLVYIVEIKDTEYLAHILPILIKEGRRERESGFNRFRLVLSTKSINEIKQNANILFREMDKDDKVHLHVVSAEDIPSC